MWLWVAVVGSSVEDVEMMMEKRSCCVVDGFLSKREVLWEKLMCVLVVGCWMRERCSGRKR